MRLSLPQICRINCGRRWHLDEPFRARKRDSETERRAPFIFGYLPNQRSSIPDVTANHRVNLQPFATQVFGIQFASPYERTCDLQGNYGLSFKPLVEGSSPCTLTAFYFQHVMNGESRGLQKRAELPITAAACEAIL